MIIGDDQQSQYTSGHVITFKPQTRYIDDFEQCLIQIFSTSDFYVWFPTVTGSHRNDARYSKWLCKGMLLVFQRFVAVKLSDGRIFVVIITASEQVGRFKPREKVRLEVNDPVKT